MIEDVYAFLISDTTFANLIGGTGAVRLYPDVSPLNAPKPYVVYSTNADGGMEEIIDESALNFSIYGEEKTEVKGIKDRLEVLLDVQDQINIPSDTYYFKWAKKISGFSTYEKETALFHRAIIIAFKLIKKC